MFQCEARQRSQLWGVHCTVTRLLPRIHGLQNAFGAAFWSSTCREEPGDAIAPLKQHTEDEEGMVLKTMGLLSSAYIIRYVINMAV